MWEQDSPPLLSFALNFTENPIDDLGFFVRYRLRRNVAPCSRPRTTRDRRQNRKGKMLYIYIYMCVRIQLEIRKIRFRDWKSRFFFQRKRAAEAIRGPYNANRHSRYVELVLVIDKKEYIALDENLDRVHQHCKDIANIINAVSTILISLDKSYQIVPKVIIN